MQQQRVRTVADLMRIFGTSMESLKSAGIDPGAIAGEWKKSQEKTKERFEDVAPFIANGITNANPHIPDIFKYMERRRIPSALRDMQKVNGEEVGRGLDESMSVIALAGVCRVPRQLPSPLSADQEDEYMQKVKQELISLQQQIDNGQLDEDKFNSLLDFAIKDEFNDLFADFKAYVKKYLPEVSNGLDSVFAPMISWSKKIAGEKKTPKEKGIKGYLKRWARDAGLRK